MSGYSISDALAHSNGGGGVPPQSQPPVASPKRRRRGKAGAIFVSLAVIGAAGGYAGWRPLHHPKGDGGVFSNTESVELPHLPADVQSSQTFGLGPEGQQINAGLAATEVLLSGTEPDAGGRAAESLDTIGTPQQLFSAAAGVPDSSTAEMAVAHMDALTRFVGECLTTGIVPPDDELRFTATVLQRRMDELA